MVVVNGDHLKFGMDNDNVTFFLMIVAVMFLTRDKVKTGNDSIP
jgi:hypothetical protein